MNAVRDLPAGREDGQQKAGKLVEEALAKGGSFVERWGSLR